MTRLRWAGVLVGWTVAATFGGCTCSKTTTVLAECGDPLPAQLVKTDKTEIGVQAAGGHGGFIVWPDLESKSGLSIQVKTKPETVIPYRGQCERWTLVPDPKGERLAVHCAGKDTWDVIYVVRPGMGFPGPTVKGAELAWGEVPSFDTAAGELFAGYLGSKPKYAERLLAEVRTRSGDEGVAKLLEATVDAEPGGDPIAPAFDPPHTLWTTTYGTLAPPLRARIDAELDAALRDAGSNENAFRRALLLRDVDGGAFDEAILARIDKNVAAGSPLVLELALRIVTARHPNDVGRLGCRIVTERPVEKIRAWADRPAVLRWLAHAAVARARVRCPAVQALLANDFCAGEWRCMKDECASEDRALFEHEVQATRAAAIAATESAWNHQSGPDSALRGAIGAAMRAQGDLPQPLRLRATRMTYEQAPFAGQAHVRPCGPSVPEGERCMIEAARVPDVLCAGSATGTASVGVHRIRFDDASKTYEVTRGPLADAGAGDASVTD